MPNRYLGSAIGKYRVEKLIGTGAFAWVYEAIDQDLEIPVAIKILRPEFGGQENAVARFRREATTAAKLRHSSIVAVRDIGQIDDTTYVVMDLYPSTLGQRLAIEGRLDEARTVRIGIEVAAALSAAHAQDIIHRDIKPDNILIDSDGKAVVADFGLARAMSADSGLSATNQVMGTPHYFSPEQARGGEVDGRSDLYSLGVMLFRTATGRLPFEGDDWYAVARQHIEQSPPSPRSIRPELSPGFDEIVLRLLAKEPGERFTDAASVATALLSLPAAAGLSGFGVPVLTQTESPTVVTSPVTTGSGSFAPAGTRNRKRLWTAIAASTVIPIAIWGLVAKGVLGTPAWGFSYGGTGPVSDSLHATNGAPPLSTAGGDAGSGRSDSSNMSDSAQLVAGESRSPGSGGAGQNKGSRNTPGNAPVHLELTTSNAAELYLDNKLVGTSAASTTSPPGVTIRLSALVPGAPAGCETAVHDTTLTSPRAGSQLHVHLDVRDCASVRYNINPRDARVAFTPLDGGTARELRADSAATLVLPLGSYLLRISAPRCSTFEDTVRVTKQSENANITRNLICI